MNKILFLCTGNYYRSRFAEHLFNHLASKQELNWQADSRGLALERGINNIGAISQDAVAELQIRGVNVPDNDRSPQQAVNQDFRMADLIIALDKEEHKPLISERFPQWTDTVEYWLIHDTHITLPTMALSQLNHNLVQLIERLL
ncbi:MAG: low molecular weight phosphatase family protein [Calothrix sp. MO_192.B10]|nr:low molecular weight phosphatase family protein [Calothrix sp. MO_192.B10]